MKKQSGFTLIELLLVLAIIGIISAIAIPALLSQRSRARDKASISNMTGRMGDMIGQWDKSREAGNAPAQAVIDMQTYLVSSTTTDKDPWDATLPAFNTAITDVGVGIWVYGVAADTAIRGVATVLGQTVYQVSEPGNNLPGFLAGGTLCQNQQATGPVYTVAKVSSLE